MLPFPSVHARVRSQVRGRSAIARLEPPSCGPQSDGHAQAGRLDRRRALLFLAGAALALSVHGASGRAHAEEVPVPVGLQAELLAKLAAYDKNLPARAGPRLHVLILSKPQIPESMRVAAQMQKALEQIPTIAGLPQDTQIAAYTTAEDLAIMCRSKRVAILYVTPGFDGDVGAIAKNLEGVDVLSVAAVASYVPKGIVLGFDLVSGKPKLVVNLTHARLQKVAFKADVLKLMKIHD